MGSVRFVEEPLVVVPVVSGWIVLSGVTVLPGVAVSVEEPVVDEPAGPVISG